MIYNPGDIVLINYPYTSATAAKRRPAVIVSNAQYNDIRNEFVAMPITSQMDRTDFPGDTVIMDWNKTGLRKPGITKGILFTLEEHIIVKLIGHMTHQDLESIRISLKEILGLL
jgi:mRNA interferase MazF